MSHPGCVQISDDLARIPHIMATSRTDEVTVSQYLKAPDLALRSALLVVQDHIAQDRGGSRGRGLEGEPELDLAIGGEGLGWHELLSTARAIARRHAHVLEVEIGDVLVQCIGDPDGAGCVVVQPDIDPLQHLALVLEGSVVSCEIENLWGGITRG